MIESPFHESDTAPSPDLLMEVFRKSLEYHRMPNPNNQLVILAELQDIMRRGGFGDYYEIRGI